MANDKGEFWTANDMHTILYSMALSKLHGMHKASSVYVRILWEASLPGVWTYHSRGKEDRIKTYGPHWDDFSSSLLLNMNSYLMIHNGSKLQGNQPGNASGQKPQAYIYLTKLWILYSADSSSTPFDKYMHTLEYFTAQGNLPKTVHSFMWAVYTGSYYLTVLELAFLTLFRSGRSLDSEFFMQNLLSPCNRSTLPSSPVTIMPKFLFSQFSFF